MVISNTLFSTDNNLTSIVFLNFTLYFSLSHFSYWGYSLHILYCLLNNSLLHLFLPCFDFYTRVVNELHTLIILQNLTLTIYLPLSVSFILIMFYGNSHPFIPTQRTSFSIFGKASLIVMNSLNIFQERVYFSNSERQLCLV